LYGVPLLRLRSACVLTACFLCCQLLSGVAQAQPASGTTQFTLGNGLTVIVKPDRRAPTAVHMVWVRVGSMDEVDGAAGVAHVLEHMLFKGTPTVKAGEFSRRVAALGGRENAFTSKDYTGYYQQIPPAQPGRRDAARELTALRTTQWTDEDVRQGAGSGEGESAACARRQVRTPA